MSAEGFAGVGDEAYVCWGYGGNQRAVIKFSIARYVGEVNAPSVENAGALAAQVAEMLKPQ